MPNPYLTAALRAQDAKRPKVAPKTSEAPAPVEKAATSASKSDTNPPSEEN